MFNFQTVLVLAPHTDDGEFGCGGTIAKLVEAGATVHYVAFSICEISVPEGFPSDILATEVKSATQVLNIPSENLTVYHYPVRDFLKYRQEILELLVAARQRLNPDLVFLPSTNDIHQDHQVVTQEGIRAFKHTTILGYELPWNNLQFDVSALVPLEYPYIQKKIQAIQRYKSQAHRNYAHNEFIDSLAQVRGRQAGCRYAEAFQVIRWVIR